MKNRSALAVPVLRPVTMVRLLALAFAGGCHVGGMAQATAATPAPASTTSPAPLTSPAAQDAGAPGSFLPGLRASERAKATASQLEVETDRNRVQADARQVISVKVRLTDAKGQPLSGQTLLTVEAPGLRVLLPGLPGLPGKDGELRTDELGPAGKDADRVTPGVQVLAIDGVARFQVLAPGEPKTVPLRVSGAGLSAQGELEFVPEVRNWLAVGLLEGIWSRRTESLDANAQRRFNDGFERTIEHFSHQSSNGKTSYAARGALFAKGLLGEPKDGKVLTIGWDSDKDDRSRFLRDLNPVEFYPVYGDSARIGFDARSAKRAYVRLDAKQNYLLYGDFTTGDEIRFGNSLTLPAAQLGTGLGSNLGTGLSGSPLAQSASQTGVNGGSLATFGATGAPVLRKLAQYQRSATGLRGHYQNEVVGVNGFALYDNLKQVIEEYRANGTSGPFAIRNNRALANSEKVEIIVRDKNQSDRVLQVIPLTRFEDYSFEPFDGRILFKQAIASLTPNGDPQSVRVSYEVDQGGEQFWVGGVDGQVKLGQHAVLAASAVDDHNPESPYKVQGVSLGWRLGERTRLVGEWAHTDSTAYSAAGQIFSTPSGRAGEVGSRRTGNAGRFELEHRGERFQFSGYWQRAQDGFVNQAAGISPGHEEAGLKLVTKATDSINLYLDGARSEDHLSDAERTSVRVGVLAKLSPQLGLEASIGHVRERGVPDAGLLVASVPGNSQAPGGGGFFGSGSSDSVLSPVTGNLITSLAANPASGSTGNNGSTDQRELDATTVRLGLQYQPDQKWLLAAEAEHGTSGTDQRRHGLGAQYRINERTRSYLRYENQSGLGSAYALNPAQRSHSLVAGVESEFLPNTNLFSEYRLRDAQSIDQANLRDQQLATGLRNTWNVAQGVAVNSSAEYLKVVQGSAQTGLALAGGIDYTANPRYKASAKLEYRRLSDNTRLAGDQGQRQWLNTLSLTAKLNRDYSLLARNYALYTQNRDDAAGQPLGNIWQNRAQLGLAWRPVDHNRFNGLLRYENKIVRDEAAVDGENYRANILSSHLDWHPSRPWWWTGRIAAKTVRDLKLPEAEQRYSAWLLGGRVVYDVTENIDLGLLLSRLYSPQGGSRQHAVGIEAGYLLKENLWLSLGYNRSGFTDRDLSAADYTARGVYLRLRFKFDETLFKGGDKHVNRALAR